MAGSLLILAIETATGCGSVSLTRGGLSNGHLLAEATVQPEITHSRRLLGSVDWIMQAAGVNWSELDGVAVSLGPGSFTGLRIGMAAGKGIVLASGVSFIGVNTLDAMAMSFPFIDRPLWCLLDARKQEVYAACYQPGKEGRPERIGRTEVLRPGLLMEKIQAPCFLAGPGVDEYYDLFSAVKGVQLVSTALCSPGAARVGFLAADKLAAGQTMDPGTAVPLYVRASEAEINLRKKSS
jgi:tRNA threonylcarbamoyladenosine biosynthesis protein TsaB